MSQGLFIPSALQRPSVLEVAARNQLTKWPRAGRYRLGRAGRCPKTPTLTICITDDSGSVIGPAGSDPLSNRYGEMQRALHQVGLWCTCGQCKAAITHFDTPSSGCINPTPLTRVGRRILESGLAIPSDAAGTSMLGPSLARAQELARQFEDHLLVLVVLTDWELFDTDVPGLYARLADFPGHVYAVGLGGPPPAEQLDPTIHQTSIRGDQPPGSLARAVFSGLTTYRPGRELLP